MKIYSKFKDYYDYLAHVYGEDDRAGYHRTNVCPKEEAFIDTDYLWLNRHADIFDIEALFICGRDYYLHKGRLIHPEDIPTIFNDLVHKNYFVFRQYSLADQAATQFSIPFGKRPINPKIMEIHKRFKHPVLLAKGPQWVPTKKGKGKHAKLECERKFEIHTEVPVLGPTGIPSLIDPDELYQEIEYFLLNVLQESPDASPVPKSTDTDKIVQHGFDLVQSFRHRK